MRANGVPVLLQGRLPWVIAAAALVCVAAAARNGAPETGSGQARAGADPGIEGTAGGFGPAAGAGSLTGMVTVGPQLAPRRIRFNLYPDFVRPAEPPAEAPPAAEAAHVVVYLKSAPGSAAPAAAAVVRQEGLTFQPHVLAVVKGTTVEFPNEDPVYHNVFSLSRAASFDLGRYPRGSSRSVRFDTPGIVKVFCHIHSDMSAVILVLDNPYFTRPDASGRYRIDGVPPGEYTAVAWHERARPQARRVRVDSGRTAPLDFNIPLTEPEPGG